MSTEIDAKELTPFQIFGKHIVALLFLEKDASKIVSPYARPASGYVLSGVVVSIKDHWFVLTARHCLTQLCDQLRERRRTIELCRIYDCFEPSATHRAPVPFDYSAATKVLLGEHDRILDIAAIPIGENTRDLLCANRVVPLSENSIAPVTFSCMEYWLCGVPVKEIVPERVNSDGSIMPAEFTNFAMKVEAIPERPEGFSPKVAPCFYGQLVGPWIDEKGKSVTPDITGMSGGPLFAVNRNQSDSWRYWLIGIQSRWLDKSERIEAASAMIACGSIAEVLKLGKSLKAGVYS